jgi:hypothetical protein
VVYAVIADFGVSAIALVFLGIMGLIVAGAAVWITVDMIRYILAWWWPRA